MTHHRLDANPDTVRVGMFDAAFPPVLTVASGDTVTIECLSGLADVMPPPGGRFTVPAALARLHAAAPERMAGHILTGPVGVAGAKPGDMLEVRIEAVEPAWDWGYTLFRPLAGTLPEAFPTALLSHISIDRGARTCKPGWGPTLPLAPFFGTMGVAPRPAYGRLSSREPREHGGNLDNRELVAGATLYLPVFVGEARFSVGDGHGRQGDGEVCVTALETALTGTFTFILHEGGGETAPRLTYPRAKTPTHHITMGMHADLDRALEIALLEMIAFITAHSRMSREQAYQLCSLAVDFRITQSVNGERGVHAMLARNLLDG